MPVNGTHHPSIISTFVLCNPPRQPSRKIKQTLRSRSEILLERTQELSLLLWSLVGTVTEFGRGVDPFEVDLLKGLARSVGVERFTESDDSLLDTRNGALEQDEVVLDLTIVDESSQTIRLLACLIQCGAKEHTV